MRAGPTRKIHNRTRDILRPAQPARGVRARVFLQAAGQLQQAAGHLSGEKPGADRVDEDVAGRELDGQVAAEVEDGGLGGGVAEGGLAAEGADAEGGGARGDDDARRVLARGAALEQRREPLHRHEHRLHVEVHHLGERRLRVRVEPLPPRRPRVREQDVHVLRLRRYLRHQRLDPFHRCAVCRR